MRHLPLRCLHRESGHAMSRRCNTLTRLIIAPALVAADDDVPTLRVLRAAAPYTPDADGSIECDLGELAAI